MPFRSADFGDDIITHRIIRGGPGMPRVGRLIRGTGMAVIAGLVLSACSNGGFDQSAANKVLQSVDVNLDSSAAITEVADKAVYLDEISGESDSEEDSYAIVVIVDVMPIRLATHYDSDACSGNVHVQL